MKSLNKLTFLTLAVLLLTPLAALQAANLANLRCEFRVNPLGIDASRPRLSWVIESNDRGVLQTAYQVVVDGVWDSGKVVSNQSQNVEYGGKPLVSGTRYDWKVRVWDNSGKVSKWSEPATWTMGLLKPEDWTARWISTEMEEQVAPPKAGGNLKILKATYVARDGTGSSNVTGKVSALVKDGVLNFKVTSEILGVDSAMNYLRNLEVEYELNGNRGTASVLESEELVIPTPPVSQPKPLDEPYVRREFDLAAIPTSALATVNVMGFYELYVNGKKVGPNVMGPALSDYQKRSLYETYDLAPYLRKGRNCIGLWLSRGWYLKYKSTASPTLPCNTTRR